MCSIKSIVGSDLAGETAAALAASSIVFSSVDPEYSAKCLEHAKGLYKFADVYRGLYHEAIRGAERYYESTDYGDELAWAAIWLFKATGDARYFDDAVHHYQHFHLKERPNAFFYNKKVAGIQVGFPIYKFPTLITMSIVLTLSVAKALPFFGEFDGESK